MRNLIVGFLLGSLLTTVGVYAKGDPLGRSPQQQKFDYFRERAQQLDIENITRQQQTYLGRKPC